MIRGGFLSTFTGFEQHNETHEIQLVTIDHIVSFELFLDDIQFVLANFGVGEVECLAAVPPLSGVVCPVFGVFEPEVREGRTISGGCICEM